MFNMATEASSMYDFIAILFDGAVQVDGAAEVKKMAQELNAKVTHLQSTLQRINAPNMRALEK